MWNFLSFIILLMAGWTHRLQVAQIDYLKEEVRLLRKHIDDMHVSTLRRIVSALGGELEIVAHLPAGDIRISQFEE